MIQAKPGDLVIANELANAHHVYTKEGWVGVIKNIDCWGNVFAEGKNSSKKYNQVYEINLDCFDIYEKPTSIELAKKLGFS